MRSPLDFVTAMHDRWGDCSSFRAGPDVVVLLFDPEAMGEVLLDREGRFIKDKVTRDLSLLLGNGLLTSEGSPWRRQRKLIAPSLQRRQIASYADAMVLRTARYAETLKDGEVRDVHADMMALTLEIVVETLFGAELGATYESVGHAMDVVMTSFQELVQSWRRLLPKWAPLRARKRMAESRRTIDQVIFAVIQKQREGRTEGDDLLSRLLAAKDDEGSGMTDVQLRDEAITMFVAGHETTANALAFALMLLADHPDVAARARAEARLVLGERAATADDLPKLRFTDAVIKETLRLYPPAYMIGREATERCAVGKWQLEQGDQVLMAPWVLHRDPRWFDSPLEFRPDRWADGLAERLPRNVYFPFGGGARVCIGNHFAMMEAVLVLATVARRASFARVPGRDVALMPSITLRPRAGVSLRVSLA
jgi:cytochrome P450